MEGGIPVLGVGRDYGGKDSCIEGRLGLMREGFLCKE